MVSTLTSKVFILKVTLKGAKSIWRKIAIRGDQTLGDLHDIVFEAFDRYDEHLYSFYLTRKPTKNIRKIVQSPEYVHSMSLKELGGWPDDRKKFNAEETTIEELELKPEETLDYLFDYGDEWWDEIIVEGIEESEEGQIYPRIIEKKGESPEQYLDTE